MSEVVSKKTVDEIIDGINRLDINQIQLNPKAEQFLKTLEAYLNCFDELDALYEQVDPTHKLANYDMPDIREAIQQVSITGEPVENLVELYEAAELMLPVFVNKMEGLLERLASSSSAEFSNVKFKLPPGENKLKGKERASEKAQDDYSKKVPGPPESWLYDVVRGSVLFDNAQQLFQFLELLRADESIVIVKSKNRFRNPALSGYRDFNLQIQISNDDGRKHICEVQLHIKAIKEADIRLKSHALYEFFRKYYAGATDSLKERMADLRVICREDDGSLDMEFLTNVMKNPLEVNRMTRLADLFANYMNEYQLATMITNAIRGRLEAQEWYMRMGKLLYQQGKLEDALTLYQKGYLNSLIGPDNTNAAGIYNNMAVVLKDQGKLEEAMILNQKALEIYLKALDHPNVAASYSNMANVLQGQGKLKEALVLYQKALDTFLEALGPDHADIARSYNNMGNVQQQQGKFEEALELYKKALDIRVKTLGPDHTKVADSYNNMAAAKRRQGALQESMELNQKALEIRSKALGEDNASVAQSYNNMAIILQHQGKTEFAMDLHQIALVIRLNVLGPDHTDVADSYSNVAVGLQQQGKFEEAMTLNQKALDIRMKSLGADHPKTAESYNNMAVILINQGKLEKAMEVNQKALDIFLKAYGPNHSFTQVCYEILGYIQGQLE